MKKYFTKYILDPTVKKQSDLRDGDMIMWKDEIHKFHSDSGYGCKTYTEYNEEDGSSLIVNWSNVRGKIILFLCSRDIQVGDKVKHHMVYQENRLEDFEVTKVPENGAFIEGINNAINDGEFIYLPQPFKVIGEISPEATWVTEGMGFDEEEIRILYQRRNGYSEETEKDILPWYSVTKDHYENHPQKNSRYFRILVKILGPCKHFH